MHKRLRRVMLPAFNTPNIHALLPKFVANSNELIEKWQTDARASEGGGEVDLTQDVMLSTLNAMGDGALTCPIWIYCSSSTRSWLWIPIRRF